jgi:hypothetical protein
LDNKVSLTPFLGDFYLPGFSADLPPPASSIDWRYISRLYPLWVLNL